MANKIIKIFYDVFSDIKDLPLQHHIIKMDIGDTKHTISLLEHNLDECLSMWDLNKIKNTIDILDNYYYSSSGGIVSDKCYDKLRDYYEHKCGKLHKIGAPIKGAKIKLPVHMGSMDKVKLGSPNLKSFLSKYTNQKCIMDKLDGSSMLIDLRDKSNAKAYTRGDGTYGQDVSNKSKYIDGLGHISGTDLGGIIRGEAIVSINRWEKIKDKGANARNYVAGIINRKDVCPNELKNIQFVAYEWIDNNYALPDKLSISEQLDKLKVAGFHTVRYKTFINVTEEQLPPILTDFKQSSDYEIDGIIVQDNVYYSKNTSGNPKYAKAFKMDELDDTAITTVTSINWEPSKSGLLKPIVIFNKIHLTGVDITKASGYNANFIEKNGIGIGSKIKVIRSGGVIPKIIDVIEKTKPILPTIDYNWDSNHTDIIIKDKDNSKEVSVKRLEYFVNTLDISFIKIGMLRKLYDKGCKTIFDILFLTKTVILSYNLPGIKDKTASKISESINVSLNNASPDLLAAATPYFNGVGKKKMKTLSDNIPNWLELPKYELKTKILETEGFQEITCNNILNGLDRFKDYYKAYTLSGYTDKSVSNTDSIKSVSNTDSIKLESNKLNGDVYLFTGFRDSKIKHKIELNGGLVVDSLSKKNNVTHVIRKSVDTINSKIQKILDDKDSKIKVITISDIDF